MSASPAEGARPPRLQPSPSLPNLRARNLSPSTRLVSPSTGDTDLHPTKRHQPKNHYLTPPLTPASSLKSDSTDSDPTDPTAPVESRFLIIGNVPNDLSEDIVGPHFHSLAALSNDSTTGNVIQTIYYRFQEKHAIILAFYDIRDAERVKRLIEINSARRHSVPNTCDQVTVRASWVEGLTCLFVAPDHLLPLLDQSASAAVTRTEGTFCLSVGGMSPERDHNRSGWNKLRFFVPVKLKSLLAKYGEIKSFRLLKEDEEKCNQLFMVEYYDIRAGESAWEDLKGRVVDDMKLRLIPRGILCGGYSGPRDPEKEELAGPEGHLGVGHAAEPNTPTASTYLSQSQTTSTSSGVPFPLLNDSGTCDRLGPRQHEGANLDPSPVLIGHKSSIPDHQQSTSRYPVDIAEPPADDTFPVDNHHQRASAPAPAQLDRRGSNNLFFGAVRSRTHHRPADADYMRTANMNTIAFDQSQVCPFEAAQMAGGTTDLCPPPCPGAQPPFVQDYFNHADRYAADTSMQSPWLAHGMQYSASSQSHMSSLCSSVCWDASTGTWVAWGAPGILPEQWSFPPSSGYYHGASPQAIPYPYPQHAPPSLAHHPYTAGPNRVYPATYPSSPRAPPENNQLDIRKIEQGLDTRTTVMIKNIPNKMTDKELIGYINKICPRRIDFLYLRMDFQNGCNVGYAFVNFISVEDLLRFAKATLGEKWNMYSSEKVLQMSYANYQGKEALVEKFKNSCIMDEREEWRPKIFYSDPGPKQGLPEEFPKPTHMRRKERSSYNRGALFVPGLNGGTGYAKTFLNATTPSSHQRAGRLLAVPQGDDRQRKLN